MPGLCEAAAVETHALPVGFRTQNLERLQDMPPKPPKRDIPIVLSLGLGCLDGSPMGFQVKVALHFL